MAITTVNPRYEGFIFDGENSRDYGIYVQDVKVFGAPTRDVEMISIPGRDGEFALDKGRFNNIQVVYTCALGTDTKTDFNTGVSDFRNWLASRKGYKRLEDEINTAEYRMAVFKDGLDVSTLNKETGTFEVTFDCKPQRFLKNGEIPRTIGGSVTNTQTKSGAVVSLESDGGEKATALVANIEAVQTGSGDPSPSNVRAITGWTEAKVFDTGKNLVDESTATGFNAAVTVDGGYISVTKNASSVYPAAHINIYLRAGVTYTVSATCVQATPQAKLAIRDAAPSNTTVAMMTGYFTDGQRKSVTYTPTKSGMYRVALFSCFGTADTGTAIFTDIQLELGATATTYEPYTGTTTPTALGTTVYGGTVDVVTGVLTVTHAMVDLGTLAWTLASASGVNYFRSAALNGAKIATGGQASAMCSSYKPISGTSLSYFLAQNNVVWTAPSNISTVNPYACIRDDRYTDAASFKSAVSGVLLVYELATPQTYNLTAQQVELLAGQNNVWADTGDISITYGHDPNKLVNPTLFEASPLLQVWGYGDINLNDETVIVSDVPIGRVILANAVNPESGQTYYTGNTYTFTIDPSALDTGDDIYGMYMDGNRLIGRGLKYTVRALTAYGYEPLTGTVARISEHAFDFEYGTADTFTIVNNNLQYEILRISDAQTITGVLKYRIEVAYDGDRTMTITPYYVGTTFTEGIQQQGILFGLGHDTLYGDSTISALGTPLFIDLDIGEAYKEENGEIISSNAGVSLPAKLPTLNPGATDITYSNTVTQLKIVPRWWKV